MRFLEEATKNKSRSMGELNDSRDGAGISPPPLQLQVDPTKDRGARDRIERERPERGRPEREEKGSSGPYGTPYGSWGEAAAAEAFLWSTLIPAETGMFGSEVSGLYASYLSREPGDSLDRANFGFATDLSSQFTDCAVMDGETSDMMRAFLPHLSRYEFPANEWASVSVQSAFGVPKLLRPLNYSNPFDAPGNIAGGDGQNSSDAGHDERFVTGSIHINRVTDAEGNTTKYMMRNRLQYECLDCVDFLPGNPGAGMEQTFTIPLSRLEATGWAYDKPFKVDYMAPRKTLDFSPSQIGTSPAQDSDEANRRREPREEREFRNTPRR